MAHNKGGLLVRLQIGHKSELLTPRLPNGHTHRWTVFVRTQDGIDFRDRSFVEKVRFELHPDFPNFKRTVKEPPYQVTETGYAGFGIPVSIWLAGKAYKVTYDFNLTMELSASYSKITTFTVDPYTPEFYSVAKRFGAQKVAKDQLSVPGRSSHSPLPSFSSISPPPGKIRKKERFDDVSVRPSPPPEKIRKKEKDRSAELSARSSPVPPIDKLKIRPGEKEKESKKRPISSISPPIKEKRKEEAVPSSGEAKEKKKKENKLLSSFVLDRQRPSPSPSPAVVDKLKREEKRKDLNGSPISSTSTAIERLKKEEKKRDKMSSSPTPPFGKEEKEKKKDKDKNGLTPSPPEKEKRKEKEADRLQGISPPERQKEKERKEKRDKDADRPAISGLIEKKKVDKEREKEREKEKVKEKVSSSSALPDVSKREKEKVLPSFPPDLTVAKREKEKKRDKDKERDRSKDLLRPPADREKEREREKRKELNTISPPPVLLRQECASSAAGSSSHGKSTSPPTLVAVGNGRPSSSLSFSGFASGSTVASQPSSTAHIPSLLTSTFPPPSPQTATSSSSHGLEPSPSGYIGGRETPSEKAHRSSISPGLRNEETASSGGSSASSHSSNEQREQKRIPKLAPTKGERPPISAPAPSSVDESTLRRKIESLRDPDVVFEVASLLIDLEVGHIDRKSTPPRFDFDLSTLDQKDLLRVESILNGS